MRPVTLWAYVSFAFAGLTLVALVLPQFQIMVWESGHRSLLFLWGGHQAVGATVPLSVYAIAAVWGLAAVAALIRAGWLLRAGQRSAIAWMNWAAFFLAMELIFLLSAAEEVLTDLRVQELQADSLAQIGSWISFGVLVVLLFVPGRAKKSLMQTTPAA